MAENIDPDYKRQILKAVAYHFPDAKVILFGSRARGTNEEGADADIAIDDGKPIDPGEKYRLKVTLENTTIPIFVDVVDMRTIPEHLKEIILKEGIVWKN